MKTNNNVAEATQEFKKELTTAIRDIVMNELSEHFPKLRRRDIKVRLNIENDGVGMNITLPRQSLGISARQADEIMKVVSPTLDKKIADMLHSKENEKTEQIDALEQQKAALVESIKKLAKNHGTEPTEEWRTMYEDIKKRLAKKKDEDIREAIKRLVDESDRPQQDVWQDIYKHLHEMHNGKKQIADKNKPHRKDGVDCFRDFFDNLIDGFFK